MNLRIEARPNCMEVWPVGTPDKAELGRLAAHLKSWGFPPDFHGPRPATEQELASIAEMRGVAEWVREKGLIWYEWPLILQRSKEHAEGPGFDDLCAELVKREKEISSTELSEILRTVRFRNLPPGSSGRRYM